MLTGLEKNTQDTLHLVTFSSSVVVLLVGPQNNKVVSLVPLWNLSTLASSTTPTSLNGLATY